MSQHPILRSNVRCLKKLKVVSGGGWTHESVGFFEEEDLKVNKSRGFAKAKEATCGNWSRFCSCSIQLYRRIYAVYIIFLYVFKHVGYIQKLSYL